MSARMRAKKDRARRKALRRKQQQQAKRQVRRPVSEGEQLQELLRWFLPDARIFAGLRLHGNTSWLPVSLVWLALCWAWQEARNVTDAFETAVRQCRVLGFVSLTTYQGFMAALVTWTGPLMRVLWPVLHRRMQQIGGRFWEIEGWVPIAFDGSRSTAPRTQSAEQAFCASNYGKGQTAKYRKKKTKGLRRKRNAQNKPQPQEPQVWITLLWHMALRLPWKWLLGPSNSSERGHVMEMIDEGEFPENTLFCGDAGFVGYPLWSRILARGSHFLVRVGANVSLLTEMDCRREKNGLVLCWPEAVIRSGQPPLRLRLVRVKIGKTKVWMLTSVLDPLKLSKTEIARFYRMRWGIEIEFRGLKQTLDRARLRCRNDQRLLAELNWSIMAMAVAELFALKEQLAPARSRRGAKAPTSTPQQRSLANTMRALRSCLSHLTDASEPGWDLSTRLRQAVTDDYIRRSSKRARYRPRNPDKKPLGDPKIRKLTAQEKKKLRAFTSQTSAA